MILMVRLLFGCLNENTYTLLLKLDMNIWMFE